MLPEVSNFPNSFDSNENLYLVHDSLRLRLAEDYNPGDTTITVEGDPDVFLQFPNTGILTLTEQCSDIEERAISFYYTGKGTNTFTGLSLLPTFPDVVKPKRITNVTQNVMAAHHNALKDALIAIENFVGVKGTIDTRPLGETMEGRINFLRKLVLTPKAWYTVNSRIGLVPFTVTFKDQSYRTGGKATYIWDFGDSTCSVISGISTCSVISNISVTSVVPVDAVNVIVTDLDGGTVEKTYTKPGKYTVSLRVINEFGEDTVVFRDLITARIEAPDEAVINFLPRSGQILTEGLPVDGPYTTVPKIRSSVNTFIDMEVPTGINPNTGRSYSGEELAGGTPIDPIDTYSWGLSDDLEQPNLRTARAAYSIGGVYDLKLRVDTELGAYRITTYEDVIDIVETTNLWLWVYESNEIAVRSHEFGLLSETFQTLDNTTNIIRDDSFLDGTNNEEQAKREFERNNGFAARGTTPSGQRGTSLLFYASGGSNYSAMSSQMVKGLEYNGFLDTYTNPFNVSNTISRPWNWAFLSNDEKAWFLFGPNSLLVPNSNESYQTVSEFDLLDFSLRTPPLQLAVENYKNGANELRNHPNGSLGYDGSGEPLAGRFAVYRTAWKDQTGYIIRNDNVGTFFKLKSFYKTEGSLDEPITLIRKLPNVGGPVKIEGELVPLSNGVFFFNNSGTIAAYNDTSGVWETGGPSSNSTSFRSIQDSSVSGFDDPANTLLAASDKDKIAYLSYDYSNNAFVKFNGADLTFVNIGARPTGTQWMMGIY